MSWLNTFLPIITLVIGWSLAEFGKFSSERKEDKKKIKKLLYNMLELRWLLKKEIEIQDDINDLMEKLKIKLSQKTNSLDLNEIEIAKSIITKIIKDNFSESSLIEKIENKIDETIQELANIFPIYAYELSGTYKIRGKLNKIEEYFNQAEKYTREGIPKEIKDWMKPRISSDLLKELNHQIVVIARKVNKKTEKEVQKILYINDNNNDSKNSDLDSFLDDFIAENN